MEEWSVVVILLTAIVYLIVRIIVFTNAARHKERSSAQDREKPSGS
jgi:hypothetical protein